MFRKEVRMPILALVLISLGGLLLHLRIHWPADKAANWIPAVSGAIGVIVLPFLFNSPRTVGAAYLLNAVSVLVGTVMMAAFSVTHWQGPVSVSAILLKSTLADILVLAAKLPVAHVILRHFRPRGQ